MTRATAVPYPSQKRIKAYRYMYVAMTSLALTGPPFVMIQTKGNWVSEPNTDSWMVVRMVDPNNGIVMYLTICHLLAPSMRAASYNSRGIFCKPAIYKSMCRPKYFQVNTTNMQPSTMWVSPRNA